MINTHFEKPVLSIIIATYNSEKYLQQCLTSTRKVATTNQCEIIIIDGKSNDNTLNIINKNNEIITRYISENDNGVYDAWNKGINMTSSDWIIFIGSDDYIYNTNSLIEAIDELKKINGNLNKIVFGDLISIDSNNKENLVSHEWGWYKDKIKKGQSFIPHPSTFHHRSFFDQYGLFNTKYKIAGDYELLTKYFKKNEAIHIKKIITVMRKGGLSNNPKNLYQTWKETKAARIKNNYPVNGFYFLSKGLYYYILSFLIKLSYFIRK